MLLDYTDKDQNQIPQRNPESATRNQLKSQQRRQLLKGNDCDDEGDNDSLKKVGLNTNTRVPLQVQVCELWS